MNTLLRQDAWLRPMRAADLDAVMTLEAACYAFPWTRGNFIDALAAGYVAQRLLGPSTELLGYFVAMAGVDELHLLNLTVAPASQGRGHARRMLDALAQHGQAHGVASLWLEVRDSNQRAMALYERYGFRHIAVRRGYYPAADGLREDARVMSLVLGGRPHAVD